MSFNTDLKVQSQQTQVYIPQGTKDTIKNFIHNAAVTAAVAATVFSLATFVAPPLASSLLTLSLHVGGAVLGAGAAALVTHLMLLLPYAMVVGLGCRFLATQIAVEPQKPDSLPVQPQKTIEMREETTQLIMPPQVDPLIAMYGLLLASRTPMPMPRRNF